MTRPRKASDKLPLHHDPQTSLIGRTAARAVMVVGFLAGVGPATARAQEPAVPAPPEPPSLARFVPADVGLFVQINRLPEVGLRQRNRDVWWQALQVVGGSSANWRDVVASSLGLPSNSAIVRLFEERVALAAPSWQRIGDGVLLCTQSDTKLLRALVRPGRARRAEPVGPVRVYRSQTGLWIALRDDTAVLAQTRGDGALFDQCVHLLSGDTAGALADDAEFRRRINALPRPYDGCAYWTRADGADPGPDGLAFLPPPLPGGALGVDVADDEIAIAFRGAPRAEKVGADAPVLSERILALPQTTLAVWATTVDAGVLVEDLRRMTPPGPLERLWRMLGDDAELERLQRDAAARIGPRCAVFLGADFDSDDLRPQIGLAVESADSAAVVGLLRDIVTHFVDVSTNAAPPVSGVELHAAEYLDTVIHELHWPKAATGDPGDTLASLISDHLTPSFAAVKDQVIISTSPAHIRQIVDAANGLSPRLGDIGQLGDQAPALAQARRAALIQPSFAQGLLRYWDSTLQERRRTYIGRTRLRVTTRPEPALGQVFIDAVDSNGPAAGVLQPGDAIIACDDRLLRLDDAGAHLQGLLSEAPPDRAVRLRVRRGEHFHDALVRPAADAAALAGPTGLSTLLERLAPLEVLATQLNAAVYAVEASPNDTFHARLLLRFDALRPPETPATESTPSPSP